jgi:hypothetical protein
MKTIILIGCVKKKRDFRTRAENLYISPFFKKNLAYAKSLNPDLIFILSAKYGLVTLDQEIDTYDLTLKNFKKEELIKWSTDTIQQLQNLTDLNNDRFVFLAGDKYRRYLIPRLKNYEIPFKGLGIGKQLKHLKNRIG